MGTGIERDIETGDTGSRIVKSPLVTLSRVIFTLSIVVLVAGLGDDVANQTFEGDTGEFVNSVVLRPISVLTYGVVALLILSRQPKNAVGWLLLLQNFLYGFAPFHSIFESVLVSVSGGTPGTLLGLFIAASGQIWIVLQVIPITFIPLFFPSGKLLSKRWRIILAAAVLGLFGQVISIAIDPISDQVGPGVNPYGLAGAEAFADFLWWYVATPLSILGLFGAISSVVLRYRRSSGKDRAQIKWYLYLTIIVIGSALFAFLLIVIDLGSFFGPLQGIMVFTVEVLVVWVIPVLIPVSIGFAILRYNMWNIDLVINRTAVYGAMTLLLFLLFGGSLYAITTLFSDFVNGPLIAGVIAAGAFGAGFRPLHRNLQRFIDQRFFKIQIDYQKTPTPLQHFSAEQADTQFGEYRNLELIGRGGMAEVYRAFPEGSDQPVAIKILPRDLAHDPEYRKRFEREVQVMLSLDHPNIVNVSKYGEEQDLPFIEMEFIRGRDLANHLTQVGRSSTRQTAEILSGIASALDYAHKKGLIHRDIKPSNVMLDQETDKLRPVLMDFGVAKILGRSMLTHSGFLGTLDYISPEQIQGEEDINHEADIYSLAIVAYQMLSGELPFQQKNPGAILLAHISQPPPDIRELQPQLSKETAKAIIKALSKSPSERFETATEFVNALNL